MTPGRRRFRIIATALTFVLAMGVAEGAARAVGVAEVPGWRLIDANGVIMTGHPTRLWGLTPGIKENAGATATINALGLRGREVSDKEPGARRVLVLGDSTWFGHGVEDTETFVEQLAVVLGARGVKIEPINGGIPGYSSEQSRLMMEEIGWGLEPDLLLVANLWSDNNYDSFRDRDLLATAHAVQGNPLYASHFFRLLSTVVDRARGGSGARLITYTRDSQLPTWGGRRVPLDRYIENLDTLAREAAARGIGVAFVEPCNRGLVNVAHTGPASWDPYFEAQRALAAHHAVPALATLPAMQRALAEGGDGLFIDTMHPSVRGHGILATAVADGLLAAGWPDAPLTPRGGAFPAGTVVDWGAAMGPVSPGSPQANLVGEVRGRIPRTQASTSAGTQVSSGPQPAGPPGRDGPKWSLDGEIVGGKAPLLAEARGPDGVVASVRMAAPGAFSLNIRGDVDQVELRVTDAAGKVETRTAGKAQGSINVVMPD